MGLRPSHIFNSFSSGTDFRCQNLTFLKHRQRWLLYYWCIKHLKICIIELYNQLRHLSTINNYHLTKNIILKYGVIPKLLVIPDCFVIPNLNLMSIMNNSISTCETWYACTWPQTVIWKIGRNLGKLRLSHRGVSRHHCFFTTAAEYHNNFAWLDIVDYSLLCEKARLVYTGLHSGADPNYFLQFF